MGTWQKRSRRDRLAALGQVSRSVPVTCAVSDGYSARILNERRVSVTPCRIGEDAPRGRHRHPARGCQRPRPAPGPRQPPGFGPPISCLRQLALEVSHRAQYRLCPVVVGLRQTRRRLRYKRQDLSWHYAAGVNGIQASA